MQLSNDLTSASNTSAVLRVLGTGLFVGFAIPEWTTVLSMVGRDLLLITGVKATSIWWILEITNLVFAVSVIVYVSRLILRRLTVNSSKVLAAALVAFLVGQIIQFLYVYYFDSIWTVDDMHRIIEYQTTIKESNHLLLTGSAMLWLTYLVIAYIITRQQ